jgi:ketol-acid reductoisomerase
LKIIADLMHEGGINHMRERISRTAAWGSFQTGPRIVDEKVKNTMRAILEEIESGAFAASWIAETEAGQIQLKHLKREEAGHASEKAGRRVRALMPYLDKDKAP